MNKNRQKKRTALGNRLRTLRRCNGMTQREVAARLHLDRSSYAYYEIGIVTFRYRHEWDCLDCRSINQDFILISTVSSNHSVVTG